MSVIPKYYIRQLINYWKSLGLRIKIELFLFLIIFYTIFTEKLITIYTNLITKPNITDFGLSSFNAHIIVLLLSLTIPFVYFKLLPRQTGLWNLRVLPFTSTNAFLLVLIYILKYELIALIIIGPVLTALMITTGILPSLYFICLVVVFPITLILTLQLLQKKLENRYLILLFYFLILLIYFVVHGILYLNRFYYAGTDIFLILTAMVILYRSLRPFNEIWDIPFQNLHRGKDYHQRYQYRLTYKKIPRFLPDAIHPFFTRDFLGYIRNKNYIRMKIFSLILFTLLLTVIPGFYPENDVGIITIISFIFLWIHYSYQFNDKYVYAESAHFIKSQPLHFYQYWFSRFIIELLFLFPVLIICLCALFVHGSDVNQIVLIMLSMLFFSIFILFIITNIRVLFYDNPRLAGYAYHFLVLFSVVMIFNFYLVGPVVILSVLVYLTLLSFRRFAK